MSDFHIKQNDRLPALTVICRDGNGDVVDLTAADSVVFNMKLHSDNTVKVNRGAGTIDDADAGQISYAWGTTDTDTAGIYVGEFEVIYASKAETYPNDSPGIIIHIQDDIA